MLTRREDKYTSAPPRCTCLPTRQHRTEVALGGEQVHLGQVEVQLGFASLNFNLASMDLALIYLFSSECNFSSRPPRPSLSSTRLRLVELGPGLGGLEWSQRWFTSCNFSQLHLGQVEVQVQLQCNVDELGGKYTEAKPRCTCPPYESTLQSSQCWSTECNFSAMLTSWEASTPRRSRGVLVLPTSQHCRGVCGGSPSATPMQI